MKPHRYLTQPVGIFILILCGTLLAGTLFNVPLVNAILPGFAGIKFNTLICLLFSAIALLLLNQKSTRKFETIIATLLSFIVLLIALLTVTEYIFNWNPGIDSLLYNPPTVAKGTRFPARMTIVTAVLLTLLSIVLLLIRYRRFFFLIHCILITGIVFLLIIFLASLSSLSAGKIFSSINTTLLQARLVFLGLYSAVFFSYPLGHLKFSFQKKIAGVFIMVSLVLAIIFFAFYKTNQRSAITAGLVDHTNKMLLATEQLRTEIAEMQSALRAFLVTGDEIYLPLYSSSTASINNNFLKLQSLTPGNAIQQYRIDTLEKLVNGFVSSRNELIRLRRAQKFNDEKIKLTLVTGKETIDRARALIIAIQQEENVLLAKRRTENEQSIQNSLRVINLFQLVTGLLLLLSLVVIYKNTRRRNLAEAEITNLNATLEKRVEEKTKEVVAKEQQYRFLLQNMREGIQVIGFDWKYLFVNNSVVNQSRYTNEELLGHTMMEKYPGIERTELFKELQHCMAERRTGLFENEFTFPDGTKEWFELSIQPVPEGLFVLSMDITERKKTEEALVASEETSRLIMDSAQDAIICIDAHSMITVWNPQAEKIFGWKEQDVLGKNVVQTIIPVRYQEKHYKRLEKYLIKGEGPVFNKLIELKAINEKGILFPVEFSIVPFEQRSQHFFCVFIRDITERKKAEENLKKYAAELASSNTELERFAYIASHDLQEPLRMVSSFLSLLEGRMDGQLDETSKQYIHFAVDGAERMKKLIQALLLYSRVDNNKEDFSAVDLSEVMEYTILLLADEINNSTAVISAHNLTVINGSKILISQLITNLLSNSIKYRGVNNPEIEVGCINNVSEWVVYVKDNGIGIKTKYFDKIFIIFQRLHNSSEYSGTGIGLAISKKIVDIHKGKIWVESEEGKGSTFYFSIPK